MTPPHPFASAKSAGLEFPLRTSLFWQHSSGPRSTWDYLAPDAAVFNPALRLKQQVYNCNCMTSMIFNMVDPQHAVVNPFVGNPTAAEVMRGKNQWNLPECARWANLLQPFTDPRLAFIPCIFCGDDTATTRNEQFQEYVLPAFCIGLNPYSKAYIISSEASKSMNIQQQERMIERMRKYTKLPIGVHNQGVHIAGNADFLCYEFSWHPGKGWWNPKALQIESVAKGDGQNVETVIREAKNVLRDYPGYVWFQEMNVNPESQRCREQARALLNLSKTEPRIVGLPVPI